MVRQLWAQLGGFFLTAFLFQTASAQELFVPYYAQPIRPLTNAAVRPVEWTAMSSSQEEPLPAEFEPYDYESQYPLQEQYMTPADCRDLRDGWYAGAEIVIVKPYWEDEVDRLTTTLVGDDNIRYEVVQQLDPEYSCAASPRLYLGYRNCDELGMRVRYWEFDEMGKAATDSTLDPPVATTTVNSDLQVKALDWEVTKLLHAGAFQLELSGGVRYGKSRVNAWNETVIPDLQFSAFGIGRSSFEGVGPTISAEAWHQLGGSHFAFVGNIRGALLFGQSNFSSTVEGDSPSITSNKGKDDIVPVLESQIGIEYSKCLSLRKRIAFRTMMEGQWWGVSTPGASFPIDLDSGGGGGSGSSRDIFNTGRDLGFFGVTAALIYEH